MRKKSLNMTSGVTDGLLGVDDTLVNHPISADEIPDDDSNTSSGFLSLRRMFYLIGESVGKHPSAYIFFSFLLSLTAFGMTKMVLKDRIRDGYTPTNAPSRYETDALREFYNISGDPAMTILLLRPKNGTSMHAKENMDEASRLVNFMFNEFTSEFNQKDLRFSNICHPYCEMNKIFELYKHSFDTKYNLLKRNETLSSKLLFPVTSVNGIQIHLERNFFGVTLLKNDSKSVLPHHVITNIETVKVMVFFFRGERDSEEKEQQLNKWELDAFEWSQDVYHSDVVELQIVGTEVLDHEMMKDGRRLAPFFAAGFAFEISFVTACVILTAIYNQCLDRGKILVSIGSVLCPILAIACTYGIVSLIGLRTNSFMLVMPFLVMGIGVDSCFLMTHNWQSVRSPARSVGERLGMVYENVGPSITITSLTDFLSFAIGALTPTPETRLFCIASFIALALTYILQLTLFGPFLAIATRYEHKNEKTEADKSVWRVKLHGFWRRLIKSYCKLLVNKVFFVFILILTGVYWYFAIYGITSMKTRLDAAKILPNDSPLQTPNKILTDIVWAEYHPITVITNYRVQFDNKTQNSLFWQMVSEFESMDHSKGAETTLLWLRDYIHFSYYGEPFNLLSFLGFGDSTNEDPVIDPLLANLTTAKLPEFLRSPFYKHWNSFVHYDNSSDTINKFMFIIAYSNTSEWETRIKLLGDCRKIAKRYPDLNVTVWEPNGMFVDQMLSLGQTATQTALWTLACMAVVCAVFIPNPVSIISAALSIASITIGVMGFLSIWGFDLDPVVMAAVLMSIGLSVDFIAHVAYHFQLVTRKEILDGKVTKIVVNGELERLEHTLESVAWPMVQAGISTICCILPLLFRASYSPSVFVAAIFLVVTLGMIHGLLILPVILAVLPEGLVTANCYRVFLSSSSEKSCRYVGKREKADVPLQTIG